MKNVVPSEPRSPEMTTSLCNRGKEDSTEHSNTQTQPDTMTDASEADIRIIDVTGGGFIVATDHEIPAAYHEGEIETLTDQNRYETTDILLGELNDAREERGERTLRIATDF